LSEGEDRHAGGQQVIHAREELGFGLAKAQHDAGFGNDAGVSNVFQYLETSVITGLWADLFGQTADGLQVMRDDVWFDFDYAVDVLFHPFEVGNEDFDGGGGIEFADFPDGLGPDCGAAIGQVVAVNGGDDAVFELHGQDGFGHALRFFAVNRQGDTGVGVAETAGAGTDLAQDHEGGSAGSPAFREVWTFAAFADGIEFLPVENLFHFQVAFAFGEFYFEPVGFATV